MQTWSRLEETCKSCQKCALAETRHHVVFGDGVVGADILLVGEAPGEEEDKQGRPFVGRSGKLLDEMLAAAGLSRKENVFIANLVKCRPPHNRDPLQIERQACAPHLLAQIALLKPKVVVCLGRVSAMYLIDKHYKITQQHGTFTEKDGILYTATFHPAAVLRDIRRKPDVFSDLLNVVERCKTI